MMILMTQMMMHGTLPLMTSAILREYEDIQAFCILVACLSYDFEKMNYDHFIPLQFFFLTVDAKDTLSRNTDSLSDCRWSRQKPGT
jgi:hypothetical protein